MNISPDVMDSLDIRSRTIVHCCCKWYSQDDARCTFLLNILQRKAGYSLRLIDWMVTNYCKRYPITVVFEGNTINVHNVYERHLAVYNKRYFDPFARKEKILIEVLDSKITTTVGQLNFFKWFIERGLNDLVKTHQSDIEADMRNGGRHVVTSSKTTVVHHGCFEVFS